ncbi:MAG: ABC transporter permease [Candidatus Promineofilum sp.]|nr:ABC transporter permease [Promineifilum sp.]
MTIQTTLARRYLAGRKLRTFLTTLAIVFGVLVIFGINTVLPTLVQAFQTNTLAAAGEVDATITLKTGDEFDDAVIDQVTAIEGVRAASGFLNRTLGLPVDYFDGDPAAPDAVSALSLVGINIDQATALHSYNLREGRFLESGDTRAAVISESLAEMLGIDVGDALALPSATGETSLTVVGILPQRLRSGNEEVLVTLSQAQFMLDMPGRINTIETNFDTLDAERRASIESDIPVVLGDQYQVGALESNSELLSNLRVGQTIFNLLGVLALLMGAFIIFNTFRTVVAERRHDIGMLRALGASRATLFGIILSEGLFQGIIGTTLGLLLGYLLGTGLIRVVEPFLQRFMNTRLGTPVVSPGLVIVSIVIGVGVTLLAGLLPAMSASRVTPLEALRPSVGAISFRRMAGIGFWAGVTLLVLAVLALLTRNIALISLGGVLFVLGLILVAPALINPVARLFSAMLAAVFARSGTAQLAEGNLSRQPTRAAITASTTLIGMAILIMAASMISSVYLGFGNVMRKSLGSDYILVPPTIALWGNNVGASGALADDLRAIDGVAVVSTLRFAPTQIGETGVALLGIDPTTYPQVSGLSFAEGDETAYTQLNDGRYTILNPLLATAITAEIGDEIMLSTPTGPQAYRVAAIGGDYLNAKVTTAYISQNNIAADFGREEDVLLQLNLASGADVAAVESGIKEAVKPYPQFRVINGADYIAENLAIFNAAFAGLYAIVLFLAIPSLIAMINTLAIGVIERTREIGMVRAVGATRGQVRTVIVSEAIILAALGTVFGILAGLYLGFMGVEAMKAAGYPMEYVFPTSGLLIAVVAGILFGVLAAIIPARQASRLQIVQALRYE